MKNGYFIGNIPNIFRQTQIAIDVLILMSFSSALSRSFLFLLSSFHLSAKLRNMFWTLAAGFSTVRVMILRGQRVWMWELIILWKMMSCNQIQAFCWKITLWWTNIAIENGQRNSGFSHKNWWFSIAMLVHQRVVPGFFSYKPPWRHWIFPTTFHWVEVSSSSPYLPSGKLSHSYGKSPCYSWENPLFNSQIFNSYVSHNQRVYNNPQNRTVFPKIEQWFPYGTSPLFLGKSTINSHFQ